MKFSLPTRPLSQKIPTLALCSSVSYSTWLPYGGVANYWTKHLSLTIEGSVSVWKPDEILETTAESDNSSESIFKKRVIFKGITSHTLYSF